MNATVLFTGGKDSVYALHKAAEAGYRIVVLSSIIPLYRYSMLYHQPYFNILQAQSQSLGIPLETIGVSEGEMEIDALRMLLTRVRDRYGVKVVVSGAIASNYQRKRFEQVVGELGLELYTPLWGRNPYKYLGELLENGIRFIIMSITSMGIPLEILGREIEAEDVERLIKLARKYGFDPSFEGGDAETIVVDSPLFKYRLLIAGEKKILSEYEGYYEPSAVRLVKKPTSTSQHRPLSFQQGSPV
ncbi:diphthine--ammonia ligase [Desulfurococcus mucosus]|uniref:ATP binding protein n=1 Tax=Desulfurococcus mucosus (strain ATCC 35584 / DSM 2162 / JCM 9187 / O7/1) TaxID=765177 RepID=E8RAI8_DESM0|nr:diphthine--ammonia ligase [Desulfurococcus mucosus]ADV64398.1 ATP binding protein [Desulfurococcus mucosus DSM 2162]